MAVQLGLRERKKLQTRGRIFEVAQRLFLEKGFERVSVAEVAREADLSEVTVFNYFPTKEDLFFGGMQFYEEQLVQAVRERSRGESAIKVFRRTLLEGAERLGLRQTAEDIRAAARIILASPSLQAREHEIVDRYIDRLSELLGGEMGADADDVEARVAAGSLMAVQRALVAHVRKRVLAGWRGKRLADDYRAQARRSLSRLERGLDGYAVRP